MRESSIYQEIFAEGFEIGFQEGLEEARQEGRQEAIAKIVRNLLLTGMSVEQIITVTGLTREQFEELTPRDSEEGAGSGSVEKLGKKCLDSMPMQG